MHQVVVIGAGFGGVGMAIALKRAGRDDFVVLERADDVGGAASACRCEMPAHVRAFSFEPHPGRTPPLVTRLQIAEYLRHCADKYDVKPHIHYGTEVVASVYDEATATWSVESADGASYRARVVVMAGGSGGDACAGPTGLADMVARPHLPACLGPGEAAERMASGAGTVVGCDGRRLDEVVSDDRLAVTGFPNLLLLLGEGRSVSSIERRIAHAELALDMLDDAVSIEVRPEARRVRRGGFRTWLRRAVWSVGGCVSWYRGPWGMGDFEIRPND